MVIIWEKQKNWKDSRGTAGSQPVYTRHPNVFRNASNFVHEVFLPLLNGKKQKKTVIRRLLGREQIKFQR